MAVALAPAHAGLGGSVSATRASQVLDPESPSALNHEGGQAAATLKRDRTDQVDEKFIATPEAA